MDRCVPQVDGTLFRRTLGFLHSRRLRMVSRAVAKYESETKDFCSCRRRFGFGDINILRIYFRKSSSKNMAGDIVTSVASELLQTYMRYEIHAEILFIQLFFLV